MLTVIDSNIRVWIGILRVARRERRKWARTMETLAG
jgi:hypothetical protein